MEVTGRFIDKNAWHVVIVRNGDIIRHLRFDRLTDADACVTVIEAGGSVTQAIDAAADSARRRLADIDPTKLGRPW